MQLSRHSLYVAAAVSGATALVYQVTWQRYLAFLLGGDARSITLVVALFLSGLAAGYFFWGGVMQRRADRAAALKIFGLAEMGIAFFAVLFPLGFSAFMGLHRALPHHWASDLCVAALILLVPTFLMGASVPALVRILPRRLDEVGRNHALVYGWNTLGAALGGFFAAFILIPILGLHGTMLAGGAANFMVSLMLLANPMRGNVAVESTPVSAAQHLPTWMLMSLVFVTGAVSIAVEVFFVRLLGLSIGASHAVFPIVLTVFVVGLALGSFTLTKAQVTRQSVLLHLVLAVGSLMLIYLTIPLWPYWLHDLRVRLSVVPENYTVFLVLVTLFLLVITLPFLFPLGRLLPIAYAMLRKDRDDYARKCGLLYSANTVGTIVGALGFGYFALFIANIDVLLKVGMALALAAALLLVAQWGKRWVVGGVAGMLMLVFVLPPWDRGIHVSYIFREGHPDKHNFQGLFRPPKKPGRLTYFDDGPNTSVGVKTYGRERSIFVNNKSDGSTSGDFSTVALLATLPYLYAPADRELSAVVIGMGTGITAGILAKARDVASVKILEISPKVIEAASLFAEFNHDVLADSKVDLLKMDAFRFFEKQQGKFDLVVSEPSNPWVVGVENLFTEEFFTRVADHLTPHGVLMQWLHLYHMNNAILAEVIANLQQVLPHMQLYQIGDADIGILASKMPLVASDGDAVRAAEPVVREAHRRIGIVDPELVHMLRLFEMEPLRWIAGKVEGRRHSVFWPKMGLAADRARFVSTMAEPESMVDASIRRLVKDDDQQRRLFHRRVLDGGGKAWRCPTANQGHRVLCGRLLKMQSAWRVMHGDAEQHRPLNRLAAYGFLREQGLIDADMEFIKEMVEQVVEARKRGGVFDAETVDRLFAEYMAENKLQLAKELLADMGQRKIMSGIESLKAMMQLGLKSRRLQQELIVYQQMARVRR